MIFKYLPTGNYGCIGCKRKVYPKSKTFVAPISGSIVVCITIGSNGFPVFTETMHKFLPVCKNMKHNFSPLML